MKELIRQGIEILKNTFKEFQKNWITSVVNKFVIVFAVLSIIIIIYNWNKYPPTIPLFYSKPWGIDRLSTTPMLLLLPLSALFWHGINILMSTYETKKYITFTQILFLTSFLLSFLSFIIVLRITTMIL